MNLFGTDGIRTRFGDYPLNIDNLIDLGKSICLWAKSKSKLPKIVIATDTRISASLIKSLLMSGLLQYETEIYDAQILPTPVIYNLVQKQKLFDFGIVITASHNLYQDNGIKVIDKTQDKLSKDDEELISDIFLKKTFIQTNSDKLGKSFYYTESKQKYINDISNFFKTSFLKNIKLIIDCANGATSDFAIKIFNFFGINPIIIGNEPNGKNINKDCGSTNLHKIQKIVISQNADIGFAFDGDGDRIIVINKNGEIKDGDDILSFLLSNPIYKSQTIVGTIMSNYGLELFLEKQNKKFIRTNVGDKYIAQELVKQNLLLGGEQSGHIILRDYLNSGDAIFVALRILETMNITKNFTLDTFKKYPQICMNLKIQAKQDLFCEPFNSIISKYKKENSGRLIIRYSGTEPILRIMVEDSTLESAKKIATDLYNDLDLAFKKIKDLNEKKEFCAPII